MLRSYDAQLGRFLQHDPYDQFSSGYVGMGNDPGNMIDEDGGVSGPIKPMTFGQIFVDNATWANSVPSLMDVAVSPTVAQLAASAARTAAKSSFIAGAIDAGKNMVIGLARMSNVFTMIADQANSAATTAEALRAGDYKKALQHEPTGFYNLGVTAIDAFKGNGYAQGALAVNVVAALAIKKVAPRVMATGGGSKLSRPAATNTGGAAAVASESSGVAQTSSNLWKVGSYSELRGLEVGLDAHHVGQKALMNRFVPGYNASKAPSILVPKLGHTIGSGVVSRGTAGFTSARQVLARDIFELRRVYGGQGIPNSSLQQLIQMNKTMHPGAFIK
jgi:hypothetical protein